MLIYSLDFRDGFKVFSKLVEIIKIIKDFSDF